MPAITRLCPRTILLESGSITFDGPSHQAVSMYLGSGTRTNAVREWKDLSTAPGNEIVRLRAVRVRSQDGQICESVDIRCPIGIEMEFDVLQASHVLVPGYHFINQEGVCAFVSSEYEPEWHRRPRPAGTFISTAWVPGNFLAEGPLILCAGMATMDPFRAHFFERDVVAFHVVDSLDENSTRGDYTGPMPGVVRPLLKWTSEFVPHTSSASVGESVL
jgi:lipopolysaccharide transport system ATP-binding protein